MENLESVGVFLAGIGILLFSFSFFGWVVYEIISSNQLKQKNGNNGQKNGLTNGQRKVNNGNSVNKVNNSISSH